MMDISIEQKEKWDKFIEKYDEVYKKAKELGVDHQIVDELVIVAYKAEVINRLAEKKLYPNGKSN